MALKTKMTTVAAKVPSDILKYIAENGIVTPSKLQRVFHIGFTRAQEILAQVEKAAIVETKATAPVIDVTSVETPSTAIVKAKPLKAKHEEAQELDKAEGEKLLAEAEKAISELSGAESVLNHGYAKLAVLFNSIQNNAYYELLEFDSMGKYLESLTAKYNKGRTQLFGYTSTAKALLPYITPDELNAIGINKAKELTRVVKSTQTKPSDDILKAAIDPKVTLADLQKLLVDQHKIPAVEKGTWYDRLAQGFYATAEEKTLFDEAFSKALRIAQTPDTVTDHLKRKIVLCMWAQEFLNVPEKSTE